jgi:hypothetical protein
MNEEKPSEKWSSPGAGLCAPLVLVARRLCPPSIASIERKKKHLNREQEQRASPVWPLCPVGRRLVDQSAEMSGHRRTVPTASSCCCESMPLYEHLEQRRWLSGCALEQAVRLCLRSLDCRSNSARPPARPQAS